MSKQFWGAPPDSWDRPKTKWPRRVRPSGWFSAFGERCRFCERGILWVRRASDKHQIAIEPESWTGEAWYFKGKHVPHVRRCRAMRETFSMWKLEVGDLLV